MEKLDFSILVVDDTKSNIEILLELLGGTYNVIPALNGQKALSIVRKKPIDLILLDIMMPEMNGLEVCDALRKDPGTKDIPIIFITAKTDESSIEKAYDVGGMDYVTKPFRPKELLARVKTQLRVQSLIRHLEALSSTDQLTGIYNRRKFYDLAYSKFSGSRDPLYAVMIDIDHFKAINDTYGHPVGDVVIKTLAQTIDGMLEEETVFGRVGGEEFAILCNAANDEVVTDRVEAIRTRVEALSIPVGTQTISVTISSGISDNKADCYSLDALLKAADEALYQAKETGRNRSIFRANERA